MLGNILTLGFGKRRSGRDGGPDGDAVPVGAVSRADAGAGVNAAGAEDLEVVRLEPVGRGADLRPVGRGGLPEKRSEVVELGDLRSGRLVTVLAPPSASGAAVNEGTALGVSAVLACVRLLSDMVAKLPLELYRETNKGPKRVRTNRGANLMARNPSEWQTGFELRKLMMAGKCLGGNGYARVYRDALGEVTSIQWMEPNRVKPKLVKRANDERFVVYDIEGSNEALTRYNMLHIKGESADGVSGISPVTMLRESIGTALAQTTAAGSLMKNGTQFPGFLTSATNLNKELIDDAREEFNANYAGARNTGRVPVLNGTFDFKQTSGMSMVDAQFIESRRFELQEIARHFGIPPFLIGDSTSSTTWGTGIQEQTLGFLNFCLDPHLRAFEEALGAVLLTTAEQARGYYFRFDRDELASVSRQDTAAYFSAMRNMGVYSVNDIRAKLDEAQIRPEDGGDDYRLPLNSSSKGTAVKAPAKGAAEDGAGGEAKAKGEAES